MKKIFKSWITWIVIIMLILYFCGFRITYAPKLENSWDAISACAGWFGVIISAVAIYVAIRIPEKIAEQQDKISLFEKRYSAFNTFSFLITVVKIIVEQDVKEENIRTYLDNMVESYDSVSILRGFTSDCKNASDIYTRLLFEAGKIEYIFKLKERQIVIDFLLVLNEYITDIYAGKSVDVKDVQDAYIRINDERIQEILEEQLNILKY